jgi:hypothetical protein
MVDPLGCVATVQAIDHTGVINMKEKRVVGIGRIVRVTYLRFIPANDLTQVLN